MRKEIAVSKAMFPPQTAETMNTPSDATLQLKMQLS